ncbi:MAG TPA: phosphotransferase [Candidatus Binataceae bacterium]|nr:phosphotransferase [Candidatus Binataceae bacterium]
MLQGDELQRRLSEYLAAGVRSLRVLASGWETNVIEFVLEARSKSHPAVPAGVPLVLRFYEGPQADAKAAREHLTMDRLFVAGYRVPHAYAFEPDHAALGAPFLVMERCAGGPLFAARNFPAAFKTFSLAFFSFVRTHVRLHRLDPAAPGLRDIPHAFETEAAPPGTGLLDRVLAIIAERIERGPLPGMRDALRRVSARAGAFRVAPLSLLHLDYHPQNVMVHGTSVTGVIDWVNTDVGDRHLDAAMTAAILSSHALEHPRWMRDNIAGNTLRAIFAGLYVPLYHAMAPLDFERFRYCQGVAALLRLSMLGMMRTRGPESMGYRPEAIAEVTPSVVRLLSRYAERKSGAAVRVDAVAPQPASL